MIKLFFTELFVTEISVVEVISLIAVTVAFVISITALIKRLPKGSSLKLSGLIFTHLVACLALMGLILQPQIQNSQNKKITLHTFLPDDFNYDKRSFVLHSDQLRSLASESLNLKERYKNNIIQTPEQLLLKFPAMDEIRVVGDGLTESQWQKFPNIKVDYHPPTLLEGIIQPHWKSTLNLGETLIFTARLQSSSKEIFQAKLFDPAGDVISESNLLAGELFQLSAQPKLTGQHQYQLKIINNQGQKIAEEVISVAVINEQTAKIMVLQSSPSFETKQLQNWAAENTSQFLLRSRISKDIYQSRSTNMSQQQQKKNKALGLSKELFNQFELLIVDSRELFMLTAAESEALRLSIDEGLGVLILADQNLLSLKNNELPALLNNFSLTALNQPTETIPFLLINDQNPTPLAENFIPLSGQSINNRHYNQVSVFQSLVQTSQGHSIAAQIKQNRGQVAVSFLQETHRLVTTGQKVQYSRLWHHLIKAIARKNLATQYEVSSVNDLPFEKQLVEVCYLNPHTDKKPPGHLQVTVPAVKDPQRLLMQTDKLVRSRYCGYFWPKQAGWYTVSNPNQIEDDAKHFFVSGKLNWLAYQQKLKINATKAKQASFTKNGDDLHHYQKIDQWFFWWLFIISAGLIWLERKYYSAT